MEAHAPNRFKDLAGILNEAEDLLKGNEAEALKCASDIIRVVYATRTGDYIDRFQNMLRVLAQQAGDGSLYKRLPNVILELTREGREDKQSLSDKTGYLPITEAVEQWQAHDREAGRRPISASGYRFRIKKAAEKGEIQIDVVSPRNHRVSRAELDVVINSYNSIESGPKKRTLSFKEDSSRFSTYASLRRSGFSPKEIQTRHPKVFSGGLRGYEGAYQRWHAE